MTVTPFGRLDVDVNELPRFDSLHKGGRPNDGLKDSFSRRLDREQARTQRDLRPAEGRGPEQRSGDQGVAERRGSDSTNRRDAARAPNPGSDPSPESGDRNRGVETLESGELEAGNDSGSAATRNESRAPVEEEPSEGSAVSGRSTAATGAFAAGDAHHSSGALGNETASLAPLSQPGTIPAPTTQSNSQTAATSDGIGRVGAKSSPGTKEAAVQGSITPRFFTASKGLDTDSVLRRIAIETARGRGRVEIELDPPDLGRIDIELVVEEGRTRIVLAVERSDVADSIERRLGDLTRALEAQGLTIDGAEIHQRQADGGHFGRRSEGGAFGDDPEETSTGSELRHRVRHRAEGSGLDLLA